MKIQKAASIPLVVHDPFFSIWSASDCLYEADPVHWSGARQRMRGFLELDGKHFCFLGDREFHDYLPQVSVNVTATATEYTFENDMVFFTCRFTSPMLPQNMLLVSRPCTYVDFVLQKKKPVEANVWFEVSADFVRSGKDRVVGFSGRWEKQDTAYSYASMGRAVQQPLSGSGDCVTIDWGYAYLATQSEDACVSFDSGNEVLRLKVPFAEKKESSMILAYDDLLSINYYGQWQRAYWTNFYDTILDAIGAAFDDRGEIMKQAALLDGDMEEKARAIGGEAYAFVCNMSFRQAFAAHKLVTDENGNVLFLSKENGSNGCIGTVDVSYPSVPLFLLFDTEYVKGMLRPVFRFADYGVWQYDFAPHDVGRYPYDALDDGETVGMEVVPDLTTPSMEEAVMTREIYEKLHRALDALPKAERELIQAIYFDGFTEKEYAVSSGLSQQGVSYRLRKILSKLRIFMDYIGSF